MSTQKERDLSHYLTHLNPESAYHNDTDILGPQYLFTEFNMNNQSKVKIRLAISEELPNLNIYFLYI